MRRRSRRRHLSSCRKAVRLSHGTARPVRCLGGKFFIPTLRLVIGPIYRFARKVCGGLYIACSLNGALGRGPLRFPEEVGHITYFVKRRINADLPPYLIFHSAPFGSGTRANLEGVAFGNRWQKPQGPSSHNGLLESHRSIYGHMLSGLFALGSYIGYRRLLDGPALCRRCM